MLTREHEELIEAAVSCYIPTRKGSKFTTRGSVQLALGNLSGTPKKRHTALELLAHERSGVDYVTHYLLKDSAVDTLAKWPDAAPQLDCVGRLRLAGLDRHERINTKVEALRHFCGVLREVFMQICGVSLPAMGKSDWRKCRSFAEAVLTAAGVDCTDFIGHPKRLTEYLRTDVSPLWPVAFESVPSMARP